MRIVHGSWFVVRGFIVLLFFLSTMNYQLPTIYAADSTQSATQSADFRAKLKTLQDEIASKAAQFKNEVSKKLQNKAYIGFVRSTSATSLSIDTGTATKSATINEFTQFVSKGRVIKSAAAGDYVAALGDADEAGILTAKKVIKLTLPEKVEEQIIYGTVLSKEDTTITIQDKIKQNYSLTTGSETVFKRSKNGEAAFKSILTGKPIIVIGTLSEKNIIRARFIYGF